MSGTPPFPIYRAAVCGLLAMLVSIGIARFGFAPLVPALTAAGWFTPAAAFWLGTMNFVGYLLGAFGTRFWRRAIHVRPVVAGLMAITACCLAASGWNAGVVYDGVWRLISGITGGVLMVLMAAAVVGRTPPARRGRVGGITFAGMGAGITVSGVLIPRLLPYGLPATWVILAALCFAAALVVAALMPDAVITPAQPTGGRGRLGRPVVLLMVGYALCALGFVPHVLFLASFVALGLGRGVAAGAHLAAVLGLAAACGPPLLGRVAERLGFLPTLCAAYVVMALAVAMPLVFTSPAGLMVSAACVGAVALSAVMLTSGALSEMVAPTQLAATWALATVAYAVMQAAVAGGFSALFHATGDYRLLFAIGAVATAFTAVLVALALRTPMPLRQAATDSSAG